jgi:serine/threonine-protein kinase
MSRVFVARETALHRDVVVKILSPELAERLSGERFTREILVAASMQEPHIVPVHSAGVTADGLPWYSMPFVAGESLRARLQRGPIETDEAIGVLRNIAQALAYAHAHGVVHRDIKPENVLLSSGTAVVTDFGIAKALSVSATKASAGNTLTQAGTSLGTPAYMAPEQAAGDEVDARADVYAWGVIAYELLSGAHPFADKTTAQQLIAAHVTETPRPIKGELASLVMRSLAKNPGDRPADGAALLAALDAVRSGASSSFAAKGRRRPWVAAAVLVAIAGGVMIARRSAAASPALAPSIVVLPFDSGDSASSYFSDGVTEEIVGTLERSHAFRVASRATTFSFKGKHESPSVVGEQAHADAVLTGSVRRAANGLRIVAELVRARDGKVLWSDSYDRAPTDVLLIQEEIARAIASSLRVAIAPVSKDSASLRVDPVAYDLYLRSKPGANRLRAKVDLEASVALLKSAVAQDPSFAPAHAALGQAYITMSEYYPPKAMLALAKAAIVEAVRSAPTNAEVALALADLTFNVDWDWAGADREYRRAISLDTTLVRARRQYVAFLRASRRGEEALRETVKANELAMRQATDTVAARASTEVEIGLEYAFVDRADEAHAHFARAIELNPKSVGAHHMFGLATMRVGDDSTTVRELEKARTIAGDIWPLRTHLGIAYGRIGAKDTVRRIIKELEARAKTEYVPKDQLAALYLVLGDKATAYKWLSQAIDERHYWLPYTNNSGHFLSERKDPEFRRLMKRLNVPDEAL